MFIAAPVLIAPNWKEHTCPTAVSNMYHRQLVNGIAISNEKERNINIYNINLRHIIGSNGSQTEKPYHSIYIKL